MGIVDRSIGRLPSHPHPSSLKEIPKILPQVSGVSVHLPTFRTGQKEVKLMALSRSQTPPIPGRLADQVSVTGGSPSEHSGSGRSIYLFGVLRRFQHCTGHITTGSWKGRGNQYIQFVRVLYCKLPTQW